MTAEITGYPLDSKKRVPTTVLHVITQIKLYFNTNNWNLSSQSLQNAYTLMTAYRGIVS